MNPAPVLSAHSLLVRYGRDTVLRRVSFEVGPGELVALTGANGAGKSTLVRCAAGLVAPSAGRLLRFGEDARGAGPANRRRFGFLSHDLFVHDELTVEENLRFYGRLYGLVLPADRIAARLGAMGLLPWRKHRAVALSRGLRQRLGLVRATLHDPELLMLDEPFSGLDSVSSGVVAERLTALNREGVTILVAAHDAGRLPVAAGRVLELCGGVLREGTPGGPCREGAS
ncbi:MAG: ABC transporter ATP-binding protein [Acidobacteria bacterium]|nr:ABC transporter ATP-binding protein [Acidobacteriota bacterium]